MAEAMSMKAFLDAPKHFQGMELAAGSRIVLKDPESGLKIKIETPKDGIVKRIKKSLIKRDKSTTEGFESPNPPPPVPSRHRGVNREQEECAYMPLEFEESYEFPIREPANVPESEIALNLDEAIYESYDSQVYVNKDLFPGPPMGQQMAMQLPRRGSLNPPGIPPKLRPVSDGYAHVADDDLAQTSGPDRNVDALPSPGPNTEFDSERKTSFGDDLDETYRRLRQGYENAKPGNDCLTTKQKGAPAETTITQDVISQALVPDYWTY
ncbi:uncharacterized protein LOC119736114 [Patiria miniata]|uniref:Uncharacterized protein n=1 Tax=Patiria miniata TaxID=46514 RepID=A0A914ARN8_PATMI|nr:uncharacterized protein LOC119736114 [Patiria miniata]